MARLTAVDRGVRRHRRGEARVVDAAVAPAGMADRSPRLVLAGGGAARADQRGQGGSRGRARGPGRWYGLHVPTAASEGAVGVVRQLRIWAWPM